MIRISLFPMLWLALASCTPLQKPDIDDYRWIRGFNYVPSYARNDVEIWNEYDPRVIERELGYAARLELNSVRIFLQELVYRRDPERFLDSLEDFVEQSERHGIRVMPVLFDSCFGVSPSLESRDFWVANPGPDHMGPEYWSRGEAYVGAILDRFRWDDRILMWDIMNEPEITWYYRVDEQGKRDIGDFCRHFAEYVKRNDDRHPRTVGFANHALNKILIDLIDIVSFHNYGPEDRLRAEIGMAHELAGPKPVIISEVGAPGRNQPYETSLRVCNEEKICWYLWELMIGRNQFQSVQGLIYPDGTIRRKSEIEAVLGRPDDSWPVRADADGIPIGRDVGAKDLARSAHRRFRSSATDEGNFSERYTYFRALTSGANPGQRDNTPFGERGVEVERRIPEIQRAFDNGDLDTAFRGIDELVGLTKDAMESMPVRSLIEPPGIEVESRSP